MEEKRQPLGEILYTSLYSIFRSVAVPLGIPQLELLQREAERLAKRIEKEITINVIEKVERLQEALVPAFEIIEKRLEQIERNPANIFVGGNEV